jgi:hypothetical protein
MRSGRPGGPEGSSSLTHLVRGHPWRDRQVRCPLAVGRFGWTNGRFVAVYPEPVLALLVDLRDVRPVEPEVERRCWTRAPSLAAVFSGLAQKTGIFRRWISGPEPGNDLMERR